MKHRAAVHARAQRSSLVAPVALLLSSLAIACQSGTEPNRAVTLGIVTHAPSTAQSGVVFAGDPVVELLDGSGAPFTEAGVAVSASVVEPGATLGGTTTRTTDATGRATFSGLVIDGTAGTYTVRFASSGVAGVVSTPVVLRAGPATTIAAATPVALQGTVGAPVATLPSVIAKDAAGNVVPDVLVTFATQDAGAVLTDASSTTSAAGLATLGGWTLPTVAGPYIVSATAAGVSGSPVVFTAVAGPGAPEVMQASGNGQSALYGSRLETPLHVRVVDGYGNPTPGVVVTWGSVSGAGTPEPINVATDADGVVRAGYRVGTTPGVNVVRAAIGSRNLSVDMSVTARGFTSQLGAGWHHSCALDDTGVAWCWGENANGQIGDGSTTNRSVPTAVGGALRFRRLSVAGSATCALTTDDVPYCWGANGFAAIGDGTTTDRPVPTAVAGGHRFAELTTSGLVTCGLTTAGAAWCWGTDRYRQLGVGGAAVETCTSRTGNLFECSRVPLAVAGGLTFASITIGQEHVCALPSSGQLRCWGRSSAWGGSTAQDPWDAPQPAAPGLTFSEVTAGYYHTCGIVAPSSAYCWGNDNYGDLGNGPGAYYQPVPTRLSGLAASHLDAGEIGTCAVLTDGRAACWGYNETGGVGDDTLVNRGAPTTVASGQTFTTISTSSAHACGRIANGQVYCWGYNAQGQAGNGTTGTLELTPTLARP
jgi:alpha-tubulin suppressor-like RCC1 family protein